MMHINDIKPIHISPNPKLNIFPIQYALSLISKMSTAISVYLAHKKQQQRMLKRKYQ